MNSEYVASVNSGFFYMLVALVLAFITVMCFVFLVKSYRAGIAIGMDRKVLKKAIISSATFTLLPSISILLGVIALSGTLGVPLSWLRLSVIGALQYELNVAGYTPKLLAKEDMKMLYTEKEKNEIERVRKVFVINYRRYINFNGN